MDVRKIVMFLLLLPIVFQYPFVILGLWYELADIGFKPFRRGTESAVWFVAVIWRCERTCSHQPDTTSGILVNHQEVQC